MALSPAGTAPGADRDPVHSTVYRPDIDGLRAIAVLSVLLFHGFPDWNSGGYVGVDVFFVISGYLISGIVLGELERGVFSIRRFYERRARRLLPALLTVLAATSAAAWAWLYPSELVRYGQELSTGAAFIANLGHLGEDTGYFSVHSDHKLLLHLWSLGVEEQFYFLWPLLLAFTFPRHWTGRTMALSIAASLAFSALWTALHPSDAFYLPTTRLWELGLGALLALHQRRQPWPLARTTANAVGGVGLLLIGTAVFRFTPYLGIPGLWALVPTLGAVACLAAGPAGVFNRLLLSNPLAVHIGRISYPLYLWHWPLLALARVTSDKPPSSLKLLGMLALAFGAAEVTMRFIEAPVRHRPRNHKIVLALVAGLAGIAVLGVAWQAATLKGRLHDAHILSLEAARIEPEYPGRFNLRRQDHFEGLATTATSSKAGTALFIGDSHMEHYWARIEALTQQGDLSRADRVPTRRALFVTQGGCPVLPGVDRVDPRYFCSRYLDYALSRAKDPGVDTVVFSSHWEVYFADGVGEPGHLNTSYATQDPKHTVLKPGSPGTDAAFARFETVVHDLVLAGKRVYLVLPNPTGSVLDPSGSLPRRFALDWQPTALAPGVAGVDRATFARAVAPMTERLQALAARTGARLVDPLPTLCDASRCPATSPDGIIRYRDGDHLRAEYARTITYLDEALRGD